jgi:hypothetical protein
MTFSIKVVQSTPICIILAAVGGAIEVFATALLAYKDAVESETGRKWSRAARICALIANVCLQFLSSVLGNLIATWFGPVSLVGPVFLCAQLVANMIVFGYLLGLESFNKDMKVGTYVVVIGVVLLPVVGPAAQEDQDIAALLATWYSYAWSGLLVIAMLVSSAMLIFLKVTMLRESYRIAILLVARATSFAVNLTVSKLMVLDVTLIVLVTAITLKVASGGIITHACIVQASAVPQGTFTPLCASALIIVNAITGMIIWEDWRVVGSWLGYACVFVQLILGNYLLLGDIALMSPDNPKYGRAKEIEMAIDSIEGVLVCFEHGFESSEDEDTGGYVGGRSQELAYMGYEMSKEGDGHVGGRSQELENMGYEVSKEGDAYEYWEDEGVIEVEPPPVRAQSGPRRRTSAKEAWQSIYGLEPNSDMSLIQQRRRHSIFTIDGDAPVTSVVIQQPRRRNIFAIDEDASVTSDDAPISKASF